MPTIGVSLAVPEPWGSRLQEFRVANGDSEGAAIPTHVTLVPPVDVDTADLEPIGQHLAAVSARLASYPVHLRGSGTFRPVSPVVFINLVEGISQTEQLARACRSGPLALALDYPYHPHVTVAHHVDDDRLDRAFDKMADFDCEFTVTGFHLYVHDGEDGWRATRDYVLSGPPP